MLLPRKGSHIDNGIDEYRIFEFYIERFEIGKQNEGGIIASRGFTDEGYIFGVDKVFVKALCQMLDCVNAVVTAVDDLAIFALGVIRRKTVVYRNANVSLIGVLARKISKQIS